MTPASSSLEDTCTCNCQDNTNNLVKLVQPMLHLALAQVYTSNMCACIKGYHIYLPLCYLSLDH